MTEVALLPPEGATRVLLAVADALWDRLPSLIEGQVALARTLRSYDCVSDDDLLRSARRNVVQVVATLSGSRPPLVVDEEVRAASALRARQGVDPDDVILCYRLAMGSLCDALIEEATRQGLPPEATPAAIRDLWSITDRYSYELAVTRSRLDAGLVRRQDRQRLIFLERALAGCLDQSELVLSGAKYGLTPNDDYWVVRARPDSLDRSDLIKHLQRFAAGSPTGPLVGETDRDVTVLATRRPTPFKRSTPIAVIGPVWLGSVSRGFDEATRLLEVARRFGRGGIIDGTSLGVLIAVANEPELGESLYGKYVEPVRNQGGPMAEVLIDTVRAFLDHNRGYQSTAEALQIHVNTLRHRLLRYEELVRDSLGRPETAFEIWWAFHYAHIRRSPNELQHSDRTTKGEKS